MVFDDIEFHTYVVEKGTPSSSSSSSDGSPVVARDGEWFTIKIKRLFDWSLLVTSKLQHKTCDFIGGIDLANADEFYTVRQRMGFFRSQVERVLHKVVAKSRLNDTVHVSFEIDPLVLDESGTCKDDSNGDDGKRVSLDLKFEIRVVDVETDANYSRVHEKSARQLYDTAMEHKSDANALYTARFVRTAFQRYHRAISFAIIAEQMVKGEREEEEDNDEKEEKEEDLRSKLKQLKAQIYGNLAACQLAVAGGNAKMAIVNATKCLETGSENNVKALFRRAKAYSSLNMFDESLGDLQQALKLEPTNGQLREHLTCVEKQKKAYNQDLSSKLKKMFS